MQPGWRRAYARSCLSTGASWASCASIIAIAIETCSRAVSAVRAVEPVTDHQRAALRAAVVIQRRLDPLLPLATLLRQLVAQPHLRARIEDVLGRDPRFRQPVDHQQLAQMLGVGAVGQFRWRRRNWSGGLGAFDWYLLSYLVGSER